MKTTLARVYAGCAVFLGLWIVGAGNLSAGARLHPPEGESWRYEVLGESTYFDDCPPCARPPIRRPLRGSFWVGRGQSTPLFDRFVLSRVRFSVGGEGPGSVHLEGSGQVEIGGEVAVVTRAQLELVVRRDGMPDETLRFESQAVGGTPDWPGLKLELVEVNPSPFRVLYLSIDAMALRDLWFTTVAEFTAALPGPNPVRVSRADLLSRDGHVVVKEARFAEAMTLPSGMAAPPIDAVTVVPEGRLRYSVVTEMKTLELGVVDSGDLMDLGGSRAVPAAQFAHVLSTMPAAMGLDAIQWREDGTYLFSIRDPVFSDRLGVAVGAGDLLSTDGRLLRRNAELLKAFHVTQRARDYGLDSVHLWPSGEIWFSTSESVPLEGGGLLSDGDLLSDRGRVIFRNLELLERFGPLEDAANFGLRSVEIVSDVDQAEGRPTLTFVSREAVRAEAVIQGAGPGRFFQVERASTLGGPFTPVSGIGPAGSWIVRAPEGVQFYRLRQW